MTPLPCSLFTHPSPCHAGPAPTPAHHPRTAVDQLTKFNRRLADLSPGPNPHLIDGIVLTKFDTIDDKVGAALSMVYTSGAPIVFVGCGQTYVDLKRLHVKSIVAALLK